MFSAEQVPTKLIKSHRKWAHCSKLIPIFFNNQYFEHQFVKVILWTVTCLIVISVLIGFLLKYSLRHINANNRTIKFP